jgi:hypothetical protein
MLPPDIALPAAGALFPIAGLLGPAFVLGTVAVLAALGMLVAGLVVERRDAHARMILRGRPTPVREAETLGAALSAQARPASRAAAATGSIASMGIVR